MWKWNHEKNSCHLKEGKKVERGRQTRTRPIRNM